MPAEKPFPGEPTDDQEFLLDEDAGEVFDIPNDVNYIRTFHLPSPTEIKGRAIARDSDDDLRVQLLDFEEYKHSVDGEDYWYHVDTGNEKYPQFQSQLPAGNYVVIAELKNDDIDDEVTIEVWEA